MSAPGVRWRGAAVLVVVTGVLVGSRILHASARLREAFEVIGGLGPWGPVLFVGVYIVATVLCLPGFILTLGAGAVFGVAKGIVTVSVAATLGATAAFLVGRYLARAAVARRLEAHPRLRAIDETVAREGWKIVGLARLSPAFPFSGPRTSRWGSIWRPRTVT